MDGPSCSKLTKRYASEPAELFASQDAKRRRHMKEFQPDVTTHATYSLVANMPLPSMPDLDDATPLAQQQSKRENKSKHKKSKKSKKHAKHDEDTHRHHQRHHHRHHRRSEQLEQNSEEQLTAQPQTADSENNANVSMLEKMLQQQSLNVKPQMGSSHKVYHSERTSSTITSATTTRSTTPSHWNGKKKHILEQWRREQLHYTDSD